MNNRPFDEKSDDLPVPDGQERLATQAERDDVNGTIDGPDPSSAEESNQPRLRLNASSVKNGGKQPDGK